MPTTIRFSLCLLLGFVATSVAQGQHDTPPALPDWNPPTASTEPSIQPELPAPQPPVPAPVARQQPAPAPRTINLSPEATAQLPKRVQNVIDFYGSSTSARALSQLPHRPSSGTSRPRRVEAAQKPFEGYVQGAPINPYLNLFREENPEGLPNYYTWVRPAQQQQSTNAANRRQLNELRREVQTVSYGEAVNNSRGGSVPGTGHGTRYFNTAQFYAPVSTRR